MAILCHITKYNFGRLIFAKKRVSSYECYGVLLLWPSKDKILVIIFFIIPSQLRQHKNSCISLWSIIFATKSRCLSCQASNSLHFVVHFLCFNRSCKKLKKIVSQLAKLIFCHYFHYWKRCRKLTKTAVCAYSLLVVIKLFYSR